MCVTASKSVQVLLASIVALALIVAGCAGGFAPTLPSPEGEINQPQNSFAVVVGQQFVLDAQQSDFEVYDRETDSDPWVRRQIWKFEQPSAQQFAQANVCLVLDVSGSMGSGPGSRFAAMQDAAKLYVSLMRPDDRTAIVKFSSSGNVQVVQGFTGDQSLLNAAIDGLSSGGLTALFDGIGLGIDTVVALGRAGVNAVVALTDGGENDSAVYTSRDDVINAANAAGIPVYAIGFQTGSQPDMEAIASGTGGQFWDPATEQELRDAFQQISQIVQAAYTIGWITTIESGNSGEVKFVYLGTTPPTEIIMNFTVP